MQTGTKKERSEALGESERKERENSVTDNEIIKVQEEALRVAKETINRQKAEIAELQSELIITKNNFDNAKDRYDEAVKIGQKMNEKLINAYKKLQTAKTEARKEIAERLKERVKSAWAKHFCVFPPPQNSDISQKYLELEDFDKHINNLLEEMESERE